MQAFDRLVHIADSPDLGAVFVEVHYSAAGTLSLSGVEGPRRNGDCRGACGQIDMHAWGGYTARPGVDLDRLREVWAAWHLNDMQAGCEHQRASWQPGEKLEVVSYKLTSEALQLRTRAIAEAAKAQAQGCGCPLSETARALILNEDWFKSVSQPPDSDSPLSGCYEVDKRETKTAGWVYPHEHSRGLLMKPCEVCGHKYGSAWLKVDVPEDVLAWLASLPEADAANYPWRMERRAS